MAAKPKSAYKYLLLFAAMLAGCDKTSPEPPLQDVAVRIEASLPDEISARSVSVMFYQPTKEGFGQRLSGSTGGTIEIPAGRYDVLCYTSDFYDVDATFYRGMGHFATAEAYSKQQARRPYTRDPQITEYLTFEPDPLYGFATTKQEVGADGKTIRCKLTALTYIYSFAIKITGIEYVRSVSASVSGMYTSVYLADGRHNNSETAVVVSPLTLEEGELRGEVRCFGAHQSRDIEHRIVVTIAGGLPATHDLGDLTAQIKALPHGGEIKIDHEIVVTEGGGSGDGGFDAGVGEWEEEIVDLPL